MPMRCSPRQSSISAPIPSAKQNTICQSAASRCASTEFESSIMSGFSLSDLERIVEERAKASPDESWTAKLIAGGQQKAAKKLGEEAIEAVMAAITNDRDNLTYEAADVLYHLMVV